MVVSDTSEQSILPPPFTNYKLANPYDEMFDASGYTRPVYQSLFHSLLEIPPEMLRQRQQDADLAFLNQGITFTVYGNEKDTERIWPYDLLPRIITAQEWSLLERGLSQRIIALNLFLQDIYHNEHILQDKVVPRSLVYSCRHYRREMCGV